MSRTFHTEINAVGSPDSGTKQHLDAEHEKQTARQGEAGTGGHKEATKVHYGHAHARTEQLYQERRAQFEMKKRLEAAEAAKQPVAEAQPSEAPASVAEEVPFGKERVKELALEAVQSVMGAAREAVHGHPLVGARKLAGDAVSGALRVAREVKSRAESLEILGSKNSQE